MSHSPATNEAPHEFNKYRLREPISESFLGTRYRAVSNASGKRTAASKAFGSDISALRSSAFALRLLRAQSAGLIDRVARAAKAVRYLDHQNVLAPIQLIRAQTRLGVITQDIDGYTLSEMLRLASARGEALPQDVALRIAIDALDGIIALHMTEPEVDRYTFACGGLTPDSIHIGKDGRARLIDPGVAGAAASVAYWGQAPVALAYTAPEVSGAEPSFNPCSDVFSMGVMVWEMLAGRSLFGAATAAETLEHVHRSTIPRVQRYHFARGEPIVASVALVVAHALQRDPGLRARDCEELSQCLRESAAVSTHAEVADHCRRLAGNSAGAFDDSPRPRGVAHVSVFELPTGTISLSVPPKEATPTVTSEATQPADLFEPQTAKIQPLDALVPTYLPPPPADPITAFPISDFIPVHFETRRRNYAPIAAAATVLLALSYFVWSAASAPRSGQPLPAAAAQPASPTVRMTTPPLRAEASTAASGPDREAETTGPTVSTVTVTIDPTAPTSQPPPEPAAIRRVDNAGRRATPRPDAARGAGSADKPEQKQPAGAAASGAPPGTFIPDDL